MAPADGFVWTLLNNGHPSYQYRPSLEVHMKKPAQSRPVKLDLFKLKGWTSKDPKEILSASLICPKAISSVLKTSVKSTEIKVMGGRVSS